MHFDEAERWTTDFNNTSDPFDKSQWYRGVAPYVNLYYTAMHELGHALGLDHTTNSKDVMVYIIFFLVFFLIYVCALQIQTYVCILF